VQCYDSPQCFTDASWPQESAASICPGARLGAVSHSKGSGSFNSYRSWELLGIFQWLSDAQASQITKSKEIMELIQDEMADVFVYLIRLADILGIDLTKAAARKIVRSSKKYPVAAAKGNAVKCGRRRAR
jgi:hypothetical protein